MTAFASNARGRGYCLRSSREEIMPDKSFINFRRAAGFGKRAFKLARREPRSILLAGRMAWWVVALSVTVKVFPLPRALRLMTPRRRDASSAYGDTGGDAEDGIRFSDARVAQILDALLGADFFVFTPSCWKRSVVLYRHLVARGADARIRFGVRKEEEDGGRLAGHAWLEVGGAPVFEKVAPDDYRVTFTFPE